MRGVSFSKFVVGLVLLAGSHSVCIAGDQHDLTLEQAMKEIVAKKIGGEMRGRLNKEWRPSPVQAHLDDAQGSAQKKPTRLPDNQSGSFVYIDPPAIVVSALRAAISIVEANMPPRKVRIVYE